MIPWKKLPQEKPTEESMILAKLANGEYIICPSPLGPDFYRPVEFVEGMDLGFNLTYWVYIHEIPGPEHP